MLTPSYQAILDNHDEIRRLFDQHYVKTKKGCWEWDGSVFEERGGYGRFTHIPLDIADARAHRISYMLEHKIILKSSEHVLHHCDNPICIRPSHLFLGDNKANVQDKINKGRQPKGEAHGRSKLTDEDVMLVYMDTRTHRAIAREFKLSIGTVSHIKTGHTWTHITGHRKGDNHANS